MPLIYAVILLFSLMYGTQTAGADSRKSTTTHLLERNYTSQKNTGEAENIFPEISDYLLKGGKKNPARALVVLAQLTRQNGLRLKRAGEKKRKIFIPKSSLERWKNARYGIIGLTPSAISRCQKIPQSKFSTEAPHLPSVEYQLSCYEKEISQCLRLGPKDWNVLSSWLPTTDHATALAWALQVVDTHSACDKCPCIPPLPPGLTFSQHGIQPEVRSEIVCFGRNCRH